MQALFFLLGFVTLGASTQPDCLSSESHSRHTTIQRLPIEDVQFQENVVFQVQARSQLECARNCVSGNGCLMYTFQHHLDGGAGTCRAYGSVHTLEAESEEASGARNYFLPGLGVGQCCNSTAKCQTGTICDQSVCKMVLTVNEDCDVNHAVCAAGLTCQPCPGSNHSRTCTEDPASHGYSWLCDRYVRVVQEVVTYNQAIKRCCELGNGQLIMPKTVQEQTCVAEIMQNNDLTNTWVGADDLAQENQYVWRDGTALPNNSLLWHHNQPDLNKEECCAVVSRTTHTLHDYPCDQLFNAICQRDP